MENSYQMIYYDILRVLHICNKVCLHVGRRTFHGNTVVVTVL